MTATVRQGLVAEDFEARWQRARENLEQKSVPPAALGAGQVPDEMLPPGQLAFLVALGDRCHASGFIDTEAQSRLTTCLDEAASIFASVDEPAMRQLLAAALNGQDSA